MYRQASEDFDGGEEASESAVEQEPNNENQRKRPGRRGRDDTASKEEGPACQACRRKKARCTRRQPCSQCVKNERECVYDEAKNKPGMRPGAIEQLTQRLSTLENMFLGQGLVWQQVWRHLEGLGQAVPSDSPSSPPYTSTESLQDSTASLRESLAAIGRDQEGDTCPATSVFDPSRPAKRRRTDAEVELNHHASLPNDHHGLPPRDLVDSLVEIYFERIHPWIPMLHVRKFRQQLRDPVGRSDMATVLNAIVSLCVRFSDDPRLGNPEVKEELAKKSRETVILQSMESFSVKNLQALIICAFDIIASGRGPSAWSIVGSMARTAEQLQLSVEDEGRPSSSRTATASNGVITRIAFLPPPKDWSDEEERRRVFWNIFMMDRFCSISTGWNLSLTSADARRRLPCEGGLWEAGEPLETPTPYFGLSESEQSSTGNAGRGSAGTKAQYQDSGCLGGFAYCIEATESLSQVTSFALQPVQDMQMWLMRFKELDLRLVQWKVFLPERWREACAVNADGNMDPNLTLSHITHNTAVALLHQSIAYPSTNWPSTTGSARLPSQSSAEICLAAATEVATIARHFLAGSRILANHQFAFCLFVCGRMLLAHVAYYQVPLSAVFDTLVDSLREISNRWNWSPETSDPNSGTFTGRDTNLASKFASRLSEARELGTTTFDIRKAAYSDDSNGVSSAEKMPAGTHMEGGENDGGFSVPNTTPPAGEMSTPMIWEDGGLPAPQIPAPETSPDSISLAFPPLPQSFQAPSALQSRAPSPIFNADGAYQQHPFLGADPGMLTGPPIQPSGSGQAVQNFEGMGSYIDSTFLPDPRVSMYSQLNSAEKEQYQWHAKP